MLPAISLAQEKEEKLTKREIKVKQGKAQEAFEIHYQKLLDDAHQLFQQRQYEAAVAKYRDALKLKPGEQYAIAKIKDLKIIMEGLKEEPLAEVPEEVKEPVPEPKPLPQPKPEPIPEPETEPTHKPEPEPISKPKRTPEPEPEEPKQTFKLELGEAPVGEKEKTKSVIRTEKIDKTSEEYQIQLAKEYPEGITEDIYKEGSATITKRIVVKNNMGNEYKKAVHGWGGTFYFRNDKSTTARVWLRETEIE